jgi:hypothetical protein
MAVALSRQQRQVYRPTTEAPSLGTLSDYTVDRVTDERGPTSADIQGVDFTPEQRQAIDNIVNVYRVSDAQQRRALEMDQTESAFREQQLASLRRQLAEAERENTSLVIRAGKNSTRLKSLYKSSKRATEGPTDSDSVASSTTDSEGETVSARHVTPKGKSRRVNRPQVSPVKITVNVNRTAPHAPKIAATPSLATPSLPTPLPQPPRTATDARAKAPRTASAPSVPGRKLTDLARKMLYGPDRSEIPAGETEDSMWRLCNACKYAEARSTTGNMARHLRNKHNTTTVKYDYSVVPMSSVTFQ